MNLTRLIDTLSFAGFTSSDQGEFALTNGKGASIYIYPDQNLVKVWETILTPSLCIELSLDQTTAIEILENCDLSDKSIIRRVKALVPSSERAGI